MYKIDDEGANKLTKGLKDIVRHARTIMENPLESHHRLNYIIEIAQKQLETLKEGKQGTRATQRMHKPKNT